MAGRMTPTAPTGSRRPLVLGPRLAARVAADGPALRVQAAGSAQVRFPLDRVSRVVGGSHTDWDAGALRACLCRGIPVVIVGNDGAALGCLHPARARASSLAEGIEELLGRPSGSERYGCWLRAARMRVLVDWRETRRAAGGTLAPGAFEDLVRIHVYRDDGRSPFGDRTGFWQGALSALAAETIGRFGLDPVYWGAGDEALDLHRDLSRLLELRLHLEVSQGMEQGLHGDVAIFRVFHALSAGLERAAAETIASLARRVRQVLAEWR